MSFYPLCICLWWFSSPNFQYPSLWFCVYLFWSGQVNEYFLIANGDSIKFFLEAYNIIHIKESNKAKKFVLLVFLGMKTSLILPHLWNTLHISYSPKLLGKFVKKKGVSFLLFRSRFLDPILNLLNLQNM